MDDALELTNNDILAAGEQAYSESGLDIDAHVSESSAYPTQSRNSNPSSKEAIADAEWREL